MKVTAELDRVNQHNSLNTCIYAEVYCLHVSLAFCVLLRKAQNWPSALAISVSPKTVSFLLMKGRRKTMKMSQSGFEKLKCRRKEKEKKDRSPSEDELE